MNTLTVSVFDVLTESNRETLIEYANYIADKNAISEFYLLDRRIKELKKMAGHMMTRRAVLCIQQDILILEAIKHRQGELSIADARSAVHGGR